MSTSYYEVGSWMSSINKFTDDKKSKFIPQSKHGEFPSVKRCVGDGFICE